MPALPFDGETGWGDVLNTYLTSLKSEADTTQTTLTNHSSNSPADPHGDRAYAQGLVNPITNGVNQPNGFVQLNSQGLIPSNLISGGGGNNVTGGMYNGVFDAVATYSAVPNNGADQSAAIQNALNAAGSAGGGIVWIGPGVFSLSNYVVIPNNTWLIMSKGTTLSRIPGSPNAKYLISNVQFGTSNTPATNIRITGGKLDAVGANSMSSQCTPIFLIQSNQNTIEDVYINNVFNNPAIEINGCYNTKISSCYFDGVGSNNLFIGSTVPAVRINSSNSSTTPSGLANTFYNNTVTNNCRLTDSTTMPTTYYNGCYGALIGSDKTSSYHGDHIFVTGCATEYSSYLGNAVYPNSQWSYYVNANNLFNETAP